jgi:glycosyltransferase involved in cell wall biosynthesis
VYRDCYGKFYPKPELFGLVLAEAMACGTPVIATNVAALPQVVKNGVNGLLVPPNDPSAIREKILQLMGDSNLASELGKNGRKIVENNFTWSKVAERCLSAYQGMG